MVSFFSYLDQVTAAPIPGFQAVTKAQFICHGGGSESVCESKCERKRVHERVRENARVWAKATWERVWESVGECGRV